MKFWNDYTERMEGDDDTPHPPACASCEELAKALTPILKFFGANFEWTDISSADKWRELERPAEAALAAYRAGRERT